MIIFKVTKKQSSTLSRKHIFGKTTGRGVKLTPSILKVNGKLVFFCEVQSVLTVSDKLWHNLFQTFFQERNWYTIEFPPTHLTKA